MPNKFIVITGCSGGGKSTLINRLSEMGYSVIHEAGRDIVKQQLETHGNITPWINPIQFGERLIEKGLASYQQALTIKTKANLVFFDRCFLDAISYLHMLGLKNQDSLIETHRFHHTIFFTPPWQAIYHQDNERQHSFDDAVLEYDRLMQFYPKQGYHIELLPKIQVNARCDYLLKKLDEA